MGIAKNGLKFLSKSVGLSFGSVKGRKMVELGDQKLHPKTCLTKSGKRVWAKDYFEWIGYHHYSIDWHGKNGAYPLDLSKPIKDMFWFERFDILTNFGTVEHVENQYECWKNIHNFVKPGGLFIHYLPVKWPTEHCNYFYDTDFILNLVRSNKYEIILFENQKGILSKTKELVVTICVSLSKPENSQDFAPADEKEFLSWIKK